MRWRPCLTPRRGAVCWVDPSHSREADMVLAQSMVEYGVLAGFVEQVQAAPAMMSAWVSSLGSEELLVIGGAVLVAFLGYRLVLRRR